ncbi:MAG: hypothetical protein R3C26_07020 [Calditrichia bacterium]
MLRDILPDSVINAGDTLGLCTIGDLLPSASETVTVNPTVVSDLPFAPFPLVNTIIATGDNADPLSQTFTDTVFAIEKPFVPTTTTLAISWKVQTDSFTVSRWTQHRSPKRTAYSYQITVRNTGMLTATNVLLQDIAAGLGALNAGDTLSFAIGDLLPSAARRFRSTRQW